MAPKPQEVPNENGIRIETQREGTDTDDAHRVVISGVSGSYPGSKSIKQLNDILYNKEDPITDKPRWNYNHPEVPKHVGVLPELDSFDGQFFRVAYRMGVNMDPMSRKMLEHVYQAIFDAGVNPEHLSGKKVGVYIGTCLSESEKVIFYTGLLGKTGLGIAGCSKSMFANRVSYWLNAKGPSLSIDAGCCSSAVALEKAYQAMTRGDCEAAVVGGCNICLHPQTSVHFGRSMPLCSDGKTKSYDKTADGCVRSEGINVLFLQKANDALRIYADVVYAKTKYISSKNSGSWKRDKNEVVKFLNEFYDEAKISPRNVDYVEGFGAGDADTDKTELDAIDNVFCEGRSAPLYVGSVMSNLGYLESASGIAGVTKVLLGYHTGQLAGNLHCTQPRDDVVAIREDRIRILTEHMPTSRNYAAVNGLSVTGVNSHVLLHGHYKPKDLTKYECNIPRLVLLSCRTDVAVKNLIEYLKSQPIDAEALALFQNIHSTKINGHLGRGFTILDTDNESKTTSLCEKAEYFDSGDRPLWFVYSGMGSQWAGMGTQLMRIPIFSAAIERCRKVLEPKGIDIVHIITSPDKTIFDNILHSFVGIAACQIGLTDILLELGLVPDKIIGHSVGELGCAYADGCLTAEEMILSAYSRGLVSVQTPFIRGSMAAVGIGFEEVSKMVPPEIEVACHNAADSSTISGPADIMTEFVTELTAKGLFAKEVPCSNIAYHSRYIAEAGPGLLKYLKEVIQTPKLRSERWVSTSVPQERWEEDLAKYSSAEYHTNNLLNPVLFEETSRLIPKNAVLVEVAPHGLLQAILKRAMPTCAHVPLTRRAHPDNARFFLESIGQLFMEGYYPKIQALYPKVEFPVSTGTPHLSHLVEWAHQEHWPFPVYTSPERVASSTCTFRISLHDKEYQYLHGHRIQGKNLFPFSAALVCAWDTLAMVSHVPRREHSVRFRNVMFFSQPTIHDSRLLRLTVSLHRGNGWFEIEDGITKVATGYLVMYEIDKPKITNKGKTEEQPAISDDPENANESVKSNEKESKKPAEVTIFKKPETALVSEIEDDLKGDILEKEEIYQILNEKGHMYKADRSFNQLCKRHNFIDLFCDSFSSIRKLMTQDFCPEDGFRGISKVNTSITAGRMSWQGRWEPFLDALLQLNVLRQSHDHVSQPAFIRDIIINTNEHSKTVQLETELKVELCTVNNFTRSAGVTLTDIKFRHILKPDETSLVFDTPKFDIKNQVANGINGDNGERTRNAKELRSSVVGDADSLEWVDARSSEDSGIPVNVHFAGINATDIIKLNEPTVGQENIDNCDYGLDFSGTTKDGTRVMGIVRGAAKSQVRAQPECLWPVPAHWTLEDAATVPLPYAHALYCLVIKTKFLPGSRVLVSGGAGATGQAIIALALHSNCRVFAVVGDVAKKRLLLKIFPRLNADDITCCRDDSFVNRVMPATNGQGCEYVICGKGQFKDAYLHCCAPCGYTIDIHRVKTNENFFFRMHALQHDRAYITFDFSSLFVHNDVETLKTLQELVAEGISAGWVRPLPRVVYAPQDTARAFRLLGRGAHRGRVLLRVHDVPTAAETRLLSVGEGCQLVVGDGSGLALRLAERLVRDGARALHLQVPQTERLRQSLKEWQKLGINVTTSAEDLTQKGSVSNLLKQSLALGPVEGVFVVITEPLTDKVRGVYKSLLEYLDGQTRKISSSIKSFVVIGINSSVGDQVCVSRARDGLPAMLLSVSIDTKVEGTLPASYGDIIKTIEHGLSTKQPVIFARYPSVPEDSLLQEVENITDLRLTGDTSNNQTLLDLGITKDRALALGVYLRDKQNVSIPENDVPLLTVEKLREMESILKESDYSLVNGLSAFFPFVDSDELMTSDNAVVMPSLTVGTDMRDDEFNGAEACLYIVPGLQGLKQRYSVLCERLQLAAVVLQPGLDNSNESLQELAARYVRMLKKRTGSDMNKFFLLGHELGVLSVLDVAALLEEQGMTGTVFCLGGGPEEFVTELEKHIRAACAGAEDSATALQEALARHMCALMGVASPQLDAMLRDAPTWQLKVETSVRALVGRVACSMQYARQVIETAYARITQARHHARPAPRVLKSQIVLLRSPTSVLPSGKHDLQRYSLQPLAVHDLRAPLPLAADDLRAASIINEYIDEETAESFSKKTLCTTYLMNPETFFGNSTM